MHIPGGGLEVAEMFLQLMKRLEGADVLDPAVRAAATPPASHRT
jgi:hypothetical protein